MLRSKQPTYEVNFIERQGGKGQFERRWVSAAISGFNQGSSRHEQVEKVLGELGDQILEGDFSMRRMRTDEVRTLRRKSTQKGGTPVSRTENVDGLTAHIAYPAGEDLARVRDARREAAASSIGCIEAIQGGVIICRDVFDCGSGIVTKEDAASLEAELRAQFGPFYGNGQPASSAAGPSGENAAIA